MLARYQMLKGRDVAAMFISWAQKHHWHWFFGQRERADHPFRPADWFPRSMPIRTPKSDYLEG